MYSTSSNSCHGLSSCWLQYLTFCGCWRPLCLWVNVECNILKQQANFWYGNCSPGFRNTIFASALSIGALMVEFSCVEVSGLSGVLVFVNCYATWIIMRTDTVICVEWHHLPLMSLTAKVLHKKNYNKMERWFNKLKLMRLFNCM
jgi:hypothetical protein